MPVTMLQPECLTQPQAALRQKRPQQPVPDAAPPLAGLRIPGRARIADPLDLARRQQGRHRPCRPPHPDHRLAAAAAASGMLQHRLVAAASAMHQADQIPAKLHPVELVVAVARDNRLQPRRDRRLREPRRAALDRHNLRAIPGTQPRQEPAVTLQRHPIPGQPECIQVLPPQRQRPRIRLHRVRRDPLNPQVLQELLSLPDRTVITAQHRPRPFPARQHKPLHPALPVTISHAPQRNGSR